MSQNHPAPAITSLTGVTLIGGAEVTEETVRTALSFAPRLVAADGGADRALSMGEVPELVIGDLDSISAAARDRLADRILAVTEQETTDLVKCLDRIRAPFVIAVGFMGGRMDHSLAALSAILHRAGPVVLLGEADIAFACPRDLVLDLPAGARVSLFPMARVTAVSQGLRWPLDGIAFAPDGAIGTSNEALGRVRISPDGPGLLVLLEPMRLPTVLAGLSLVRGG